MQEQRHILSQFDQALNQLRSDVLQMSQHALDNLATATQGLMERDEALCNKVIADDEIVDAFEKGIDAEGIDILAKFTPLAHDLRRVVATMRTSSDLERISDQAVSIARRARSVIQEEELTETRLIEPLHTTAQQLLRDAMQAFQSEDVALALSLKPRDKELDRHHKDVIRKLTESMETDTPNLRSYLDLIFVTRCLERVGDHAVNIGENAVFAASAKDVRHERE